jgi:acetolactate synthase-1/3 small subunit
MPVALNRESRTQNLYVLLEDRPGALHRVVTLFRRRSYNIASLHVERSEIAGVSRMNVSIEAANATHVTKELERLIDVLAVRDVTGNLLPDARLLVSTRVQADGACDVEEGELQ